MASVIISRRVPWVALALSFLSGPEWATCTVGELPRDSRCTLRGSSCRSVTTAALLPPSPTCFVLLVLLPVVIVFTVYLYAALDAWRLAYQIDSGYSLRDYNRAGLYWLLIVVQLVFAIGLIAGVRSLVYEAFRVPSSSMSPTILPGDRILARKLLTRDHVPNRGDLIVYRNPTPTGAKNFIARVVAVAGDHLKISGEHVFINGKELERDRVPQRELDVSRQPGDRARRNGRELRSSLFGGLR